MKPMRKKIYKNILPVILSILSVFSILSGFTGLSGFIVSAEENDIKIHMNTLGLEEPPDITAVAAILLNTETGNIVYEKNSKRIIFPASTVKIMTAVIVLENVSNLESQTIISKYVVDNTSGNIMPVSKVKEGEVFTVEQLLNAMLLQGANDAALALAECVSGSVTDFVAEMNKRAIELGCTDTVFANPTGMHSPEMHTTVSDMAKIAFHASKIQKLMDITSSTKYDIPATNKEREARPILNRNHFISKAQQTQYYYEYARGINYGFTNEAGYCLTTIAEQSGMYYLCVLMGASSTPIAGTDSEKLNCFDDARKLLDWAFSIYSYKTVVSTKDKSVSVEIKLSANRDKITLVPDRDISILLPQNVNMETEITTECNIFEDQLIAPIEKNDHLGNLIVYYNGEEMGTAKLLSSADVDPSNILYVLDEIKNIVSSGWFRASVVIFIIIFAFYIIINLIRKGRKEQKRFY